MCKVCEGEEVRARNDAIKIRNQLRSPVSVGPTTRRERMGGFQEQGATLLGVYLCTIQEHHFAEKGEPPEVTD